MQTYVWLSLSLPPLVCHLFPLSIKFISSSSPAPPVNGPFVGASYHSKGIHAGECTQAIPHSDECCSLQLKMQMIQGGSQCWANIILKESRSYKGVIRRHTDRVRGKEFFTNRSATTWSKSTLESCPLVMHQLNNGWVFVRINLAFLRHE